MFAYLTLPILLYLGMGLLLSTLFRLYDYVVSFKTIPRMRGKIANDALEKLMDQSHSYYQNTFSGSLASKVNDLTSSVPELIQITSDRFFSHGLALMIAIITLWQVNMIFAVSMMVWSALFTISALLFSERITRFADEWSELGSLVTGKVVDVLSNILSVRLFTAKREEKRAFDETVKSTVAAEQKLQRAYFGMWLIYGYSFFFLQAVNFYFLCKGREEGWITVGDFALVLVINIAIIDFLWQVAKDFSQFTRLYGRIAQALRAILNKPDLEDQENAHALVVSEGEITFADVKFHYPGTRANASNFVFATIPEDNHYLKHASSPSMGRLTQNIPVL